MSDHHGTATVRGEPVCVFCAQVLAPADCVASIRLLSRTRGDRYFGAHIRCFRQAVRPEIAHLVDLADVPPGLDHFLALPA
jgi:hypothetical protein